MRDVIDFLRGAVARGNPGTMGCYCFGPTGVFTRNDAIQACVAYDSPVSFNVPAAEFEAALERMPEITDLAFSGEDLSIKGGRIKTKILCNADAPPMLPALPEDWAAVPDGFIEALKLAKPFTDAQGWQSGIRLKGDRITALKNTCGIDIQLPGLDIEETLLSSQSVGFLIDQGAPEGYARGEREIFFSWPDGRWLKAQLMIGAMPAQVDAILDRAGLKAETEISEDWRDAWADAAALSNGAVRLDEAGLHAFKGAGTIDVEIATPGLPEGHESVWTTSVLGPVIAIASHWHPAATPNPALFIGPNFRGVVIGVRL